MLIRRVLATATVLAALLTLDARAQLPDLQPASAHQIQADIQSGDAELTIVNFWATWCVPCREEFPAFVRVGKEFGPIGVRLLFVSTDFSEHVPEARRFLAEHGVTTQSYLKSGNDAEFINAFNQDWSGALPATMLYDRQGKLVDFWEGSTNYDRLKARVNHALSSQQAPDIHEQ